MQTRIIHTFTVLTLLLFASVALSAQLTITPRVSVSEEYNDNIFLTEDDEEYDYITAISAGFTAQLTARTAGLELAYDPAYVFYNRFSENDGWRQLATLYGWTSLARSTRLEIRDEFELTEDPLSETEFLAPGVAGAELEPILVEDASVRRGRSTFTRNAASINLIHQFGAEDTLTTGYTYRILRNDDEAVDDNDEHVVAAELTYWFNPQTGAEASVEYTRGEFDVGDDFDDWAFTVRGNRRFNRQFNGFVQYDHIIREFEGNIDEDYVVYAPSLGVTYNVAESLRLSAGLGYFLQEIEGDDDEDGLFITGELEKNWTYRRGLVTVTAEGGLDRTDFGAERLGLTRFVEVAATATYRIHRRLTADCEVSYNNSEFLNDPSDRIDDEYNFGAGLAYEPWVWMILRLDYDYRALDSSEDISDYTENRVVLSASLTSPRPIRLNR